MKYSSYIKVLKSVKTGQYLFNYDIFSSKEPASFHTYSLYTNKCSNSSIQKLRFMIIPSGSININTGIWLIP